MSATRPWPGNRSRPRFVVGAGCCWCWLLWGCVCRWAAARPVSDVACCLWPHGCSGCRRVRPPARSPHASLRLGVVDLEAWPSSAAAHRHLGPAPRATRASRFPPCVNPRLGVVDLEARPGPAAAHRHPPHRWGFSLLCTSHPGPADHGRRRQAPQPGSAGLAGPSMREPAARSRRSRSPAKPSGPSGTLHTGGAFHCCAHPIQAPPTTGTAAKPHSQASLVPQLTRRPPHRRCLVCWWVIGVVLKPGQVLPPPTGTVVGHQPGAVCPALVSNLARWGCSIRSWLAACRRRVAALMMSFPPF